MNDAVGRVQDRFGRIDMLINNAGGAITPLERSKPSVMTDEDIRRVTGLGGNADAPLFVVLTIDFKRLYGIVIMRLDRRRLV